VIRPYMAPGDVVEIGRLVTDDTFETLLSKARGIVSGGLGEYGVRVELIYPNGRVAHKSLAARVRVRFLGGLASMAGGLLAEGGMSDAGFKRHGASTADEAGQRDKA
jgi:hypothetical protein